MWTEIPPPVELLTRAEAGLAGMRGLLCAGRRSFVGGLNPQAGSVDSSRGGIAMGSDYQGRNTNRFDHLKRLGRWGSSGSYRFRLRSGLLTLHFRHVPRRGLVLEHFYTPASEEDAAPGTRLGVRVMKKVMLGATGKPGAGPRHAANPETKVLSRFQNIVLHCCMCAYDDGSPRTPGWVTLKQLGGMWMLQMKDPDASAQLCVSAVLLDDLFVAAQLLLGAEDAPWQPDPFLAAAKSQKRK